MSEQQVATRQGPFLTVAAIFEVVVKESNGILTLVRMIDRITIETRHEEGADLPPIALPIHLVVAFRGENMLGYSGVVSLLLRKPSGEELPRREISFACDSETGFNLNIEVGILVDQEGYYWFDIFLNEEFITRTPLQIVFRNEIEGAGAEQGDPERSLEPIE